MIYRLMSMFPEVMVSTSAYSTCDGKTDDIGVARHVNSGILSRIRSDISRIEAFWLPYDYEVLVIGDYLITYRGDYC